MRQRHPALLTRGQCADGTLLVARQRARRQRPLDVIVGCETGVLLGDELSEALGLRVSASPPPSSAAAPCVSAAARRLALRCGNSRVARFEWTSIRARPIDTNILLRRGPMIRS